MATRTKTIEYGSQSTAGIVVAAANVDRAITVYIPETVVAFRSVTLMCSVRGANTTAGNLTAPVLGIGLAAVAVEETTLASPITNSGDNEAWHLAKDCTSYFATNWSGTSMSATLRFRGGTISTASHGFKLLITYDYDDDSVTQIKTIRWPLESTRATLTNAFQTVGGATAIPAFLAAVDPVLPESGVVIRQAFVELWANEASSSTTDFTLQARVNGGATQSLWFSEQAQTSSCMMHVIHDITAETFTAAVSYEALATTTGRVAQLGGFVVVTYEFAHGASSTILNSIIFGAMDTAGAIGGANVEADGDRWSRDIFIQEPGPITLQASAVLLTAQDSTGYTLNVSVGAQGFTGYALPGSGLCGGASLVHRIDAGGQAATAFATLARGRNAYVIDVYSGTDQAGWNLSGIVVLNYRSGKATEGVGAHAHSVHTLISEPDASASSNPKPNTVAAASFYEGANAAPHWLVALVVASAYTTDNASNGSVVVQVERNSGELDGDGWEPVYVGTNRASNENTNHWIFSAGRSVWDRYPGEPQNRMSPSAARRWRVDGEPDMFGPLWTWCTYHSILAAVAGTVSGYTGDGSGIPVDVYCATSGDLHVRATTTTGGAFAVGWYDDTEPVFVVARQDDTHVGRSGNALAA